MDTILIKFNWNPKISNEHCKLRIKHHSSYFNSSFVYYYTAEGDADINGEVTFNYNSTIYQEKGVMQIDLIRGNLSIHPFPEKFVPERVREGEFPGGSGFKYRIYYHAQAFGNNDVTAKSFAAPFLPYR